MEEARRRVVAILRCTIYLFTLLPAETNEKEQRDRAQGVQSTRGPEAQDISSGNSSYILDHLTQTDKPSEFANVSSSNARSSREF